MAEHKRATLPDGEFFMLDDQRSEFELLACDWNPEIDPDSDEFRDYVPMPIQYDANPDGSFAIGMARHRLIRELYPNRALTEVLPRLFDDNRVRLDDKFIIRTAYFRSGKREKLAHFDWLADYACEPLVGRDGGFTSVGTSYCLVSTDWKETIEHFEPGVHQFFPCDLVFSDGTVQGHFVFRPMQILDFVDLTESEVGRGVSKLDRGPSAGQYYIVGNPRGLAGKRDVLRGHHWVKHDWNSQAFLSRILAERLIHLLPKKNIELVPVRLV